jgi:crotonobetainyl-CoA:carnitine CoA-transferase CaiB-like acyl-CoA transferase
VSSPFAGLVVLEFASVLAGPQVGQFFAELGAQVVKIENLRTGGDVTRKWKLPSEPLDSDISAYFSCANWGKFSVGLDLRDQEVLQLVYRMVQQADVVLSSFKPGDAEKLELDYPALAALHPALIYGHITGYGSHTYRTGYDAVIQAESGFMYLNGESHGPPTKMPVALMDVMAAHQLKEGILTALYMREKTGEGRLVEVSLLEAAIASLANQASGYLVTGEVPQRQGSAHPTIAPYGTIFSTKEGAEIVLAVGDDRQFRDLCEVLQVPELAMNERFRTNAGRVINREALQADLAHRISAFTKSDLLEQLQKRQVPAGAIHDLREVMGLAAAENLMLQAQNSEDFPFRGLRTVAFRSPAQPAVPIPAPPHFGEHTDFVLSRFTSIDLETLQELRQRNVIY